MSGAEPFPPAPACRFLPSLPGGVLMPIKKDNLNFPGFPRRERPKVPHFSFSPSTCLSGPSPVYAIKSEPTTTSRRLTDRHEFWIGATTTMTRRESSKSRQRVIYQPTTAHPPSSLLPVTANLGIKSKGRAGKNC